MNKCLVWFCGGMAIAVDFLDNSCSLFGIIEMANIDGYTGDLEHMR